MRTRDIPPAGRSRIERPVVTERPLPAYIPDRDLTYYREGVRWNFSSGHVLVDGHDVNRLISGGSDIGLWLGLAEGLNEYRKRVSSAARSADQFTRFEAVIEALLGRILGRMKKVYDQKRSGISWSLQDGQRSRNGIKIRSCLALYRIRKTEKARRFLKGLKGRLGILLENRNESPDDERIRDLLEDLYREVEEELSSSEAPRAARRLLPGRTGRS